jgi:hypothetical protein
MTPPAQSVIDTDAGEGRRSGPVSPDRETAAPAGRPTLDDIGEWSFPASDPPANWTWDVTPRR